MATERSSKVSRSASDVSSPEAKNAKRLKRCPEDLSQYDRSNFTVGIICALPHEMAAASAMLDEIYPDLTEQDLSDHNSYRLGRMHDHQIVIACLPAGIYGTTPAATVSKDLLRTFKSIRFGLLVGIGGAVWSKDFDIRLGDVVVSQPNGQHGGVIQFDRGRKNQVEGFERTGSLNAPPKILLTALARMQSEMELKESSIPRYLSEMVDKWPRLEKDYSYQGKDKDILYNASYIHVKGENTCSRCNPSQRVVRAARDDNDPQVFFGNVASSNQVMKDAIERDQLGKSLGILCFEMEAAGLADFPCLVIRGISDYCDSHKNWAWQKCAAASAAAFAKDFLRFVPAKMVIKERPILESVTKDILYELRRHTTLYKNDKQRGCHRAFDICAYENYKNVNPDRVKGTCLWALESQRYRRWCLSEANDLLWISADPGCGKSVLAKSLIDLELRSSDAHATCYFFFKDNEEQNGVATALCAILHQLFSKQPKLLRHAVPKWEQMKNTLTKNIEELWRILIDVVTDAEANRVICIFDALDECQKRERNILIKHLIEFHRKSRHKNNRQFQLHILVTSRPYFDIEEKFQEAVTEFPTIRLRGEFENSKIQAEIDLVIENDVAELAKQLQLEDNVHALLVRKLLNMEHRTYLWLYLIMSELQESLKRSAKKMSQILDQIPKTVEEVYEALLNRNTHDPELRQEARTLLHLVVAAKRPLTLQEMDIAFNMALDYISVPPMSEDDLDLDGKHFVNRIRNLCGLFVFIHDSKVYLIHQTAKEFLVQKEQNYTLENYCRKLSLNKRSSELVWTRICIFYMLSGRFRQEDGEWKKDKAEYGHHSNDLWEYACELMPKHFCDAQLDELHDLSRYALQLYDRNKPVSQPWVSTLGFLQHASGLSLACRVGHTVIVKLMLQNGAQINNRSSLTQEPDLIVASGWARKDIVQLLLQHGADIETSGDFPLFSTALGVASENGHVPVSELLLQHGANVNARNAMNETPLQLAGEQGHLHVAQLLLRHGASVNARDEFHNPPLTLASENGHLHVVQLLLGHGADVHASNINGRSPLTFAIENGHLGVAHLLLQHGANVDATDINCRNPLTIATEYGHIHTVRLLLQYEADLNTSDKYGRSPIVIASQNGHLRVVELLLQHGADTNSCTSGGTSPLHYAVESSDPNELTLMLLKNGADPNICSFEKGLPLQLSTKKGDPDIVQLLLDHGADINGQSVQPFTALQIASAWGNLGIVKLLLAGGANTNIPVRQVVADIGTPTWVFGYRRLSNSSMLTKIAPRSDFESSTALDIATFCCQDEIAQLLVDHGGRSTRVPRGKEVVRHDHPPIGVDPVLCQR